MILCVGILAAVGLKTTDGLFGAAFFAVFTVGLLIFTWRLGIYLKRVWARKDVLDQRQKEMGLVLNHLNAAVFFYKPGTDRVVDAEGIHKVYGYQAEERIDQAPAFWCDYTHLDDRKTVKELETIAESGETVSRDYRIRTDDGLEKWVEDRAHPMKDANGNVERISRVIVDITGRKQAEAKINYMAYHDALTGLPNRYMFNQFLEQSLARAKRHKLVMGLMFLDLDRFKLINDSLGHSQGDELLKQVSKRLETCVRESDVVSRNGGDEFIILSDNVNEEEIKTIARRIIDRFSEPFVLKEHDVFSSPSIGISLYPNHGEDAETLVQHADAAMYLAKEQGKNTFQFYRNDLHTIASQKMRLESELRKALKHERFMLYYQPQFDLQSHTLVGLEALLRWNHEEYGFMPPSDFISLAEETGLIIPIGDWALKQVCQQLKSWTEAGFSPVPVAVNISSRQFRDEKFVERVRDVLRETDIDPRYIELEITESVMQDIRQTLMTLQELRELGVSIAIDDFGTGWSSLSVLKNLSIDTVKIDWTFVYDIVDNENTASIVKTMIDIGLNLNLKVVAEGIENEGQKRLLQQYRCKVGQGYFLWLPKPPEEIESLLIH